MKTHLRTEWEKQIRVIDSYVRIAFWVSVDPVESSLLVMRLCCNIPHGACLLSLVIMAGLRGIKTCFSFCFRLNFRRMYTCNIYVCNS
jgi:hypothetical protein